MVKIGHYFGKMSFPEPIIDAEYGKIAVEITGVGEEYRRISDNFSPSQMSTYVHVIRGQKIRQISSRTRDLISRWEKIVIFFRTRERT